ncbi:hypothetical protein BHE74_00006816 [Ensete ventricosum]|nr:hypothetical protein GW17_00018468 [Ensete ventricosum]RWW84571.1 hypothetical protein BHE74_00006816 [Ensete ventricosum]
MRPEGEGTSIVYTAALRLPVEASLPGDEEYVVPAALHDRWKGTPSFLARPLPSDDGGEAFRLCLPLLSPTISQIRRRSTWLPRPPAEKSSPDGVVTVPGEQTGESGFRWQSSAAPSPPSTLGIQPNRELSVAICLISNFYFET